MKLGILLGLLALPLVLVVIAHHASATCVNSAAPNSNTCKGFSMVGTTVGGVSSGRCFSMHTGSATLACSTTGVGSTTATLTWDMDAGACITVMYEDVANGVSPPHVPNKVYFNVRADNTATIVKTFLVAATEPANGATYSFCATDDGTSTGNARAGTYRMLLQVVYDLGAGGVGNYDITSDGSGSPQSWNKGGLRGDMIVSALAPSSYPAGSTFAYGTAGDEAITVSATFTTPNIDANVETMRTGVVDSATLLVGEVGATVDVDSGSLSQSTFVVDSSYPTDNAPYVPALGLVGVSSSLGTLWSQFATTGHGSGVTYVAGGTVKGSTFNIDYTVKFDSDCTGGFSTADDVWTVKLGSSSGAVVSKLNKGETYYASTCTVNARGEYLSRSMTFAREDATPTTCASLGSLTPSSNVYSHTSTLGTGSTCLASGDPGSTRYFRVTNTDQNHRGAGSFTVSPVLYPDAHIQISGTLVKDYWPTPDSAEDLAYIISTATTDTTHGWCHPDSVRKDTTNMDTSGSAVSWSYIDPATTTRLSGTTDTASDGWTSSHLDLLASTPLGTWTFRCTVTWNGNTGTVDQTFTVSVPDGLGTGFPGDPMRMSCTPNTAYAGGEVKCAIQLSLSDGSARTGASASLLYDIRNPSNTLIVTGGSTTEYGTTGVYYFTWIPGATPTLGNYVAVGRTTDASPVTAQATYTIATDPFLAVATNLATIISNQASEATAHTNIQSDTDDIQSRLTTLQSDLTTVKTNVATLVTKWGSTDAATLLAGIQDLQTKLGTPSDTSSASTVFGKIALAHAHSDANDATTQAAIAAAQATADTTYTLLQDVHTELGAHGKSRTAYKLLEDLEDGQVAADAQADTYHANETAYIAETHEDVHELMMVVDGIVMGNVTVRFDNETLYATLQDCMENCTMNIDNPFIEYLVPTLLILGALVYAFFRLLKRPWVWIWPFIVLVLCVLEAAFRPQDWNIQAAVAVVACLLLIVAMLNKFGFGQKNANAE